MFLSCLFRAQDSTKLINQEIGFNTVSLVKQMISNDPGNTLDQLPYLVFYNLYFKNMIGLRVGLGMSTLKTETEIEGQSFPRTTNARSFDLRTGVSYNFVRHNRVTLNAFADYLIQNASSETVNTFTNQVFPNPVQKTTTITSDRSRGLGAQIGVGVKYNLHKHLSIYAEVPLTFMATTFTSDVEISQTGEPTEKTKNTTKDSGTRITIPTTIYLVLRF